MLRTDGAVTARPTRLSAGAPLRRRVGARPWAAALAMLAAAVSSAPSPAAADDVLAGSRAVRRALQMRASRHEVTGLLATSLGDPFVRNILPGARYDLHLFDWLSVGGRLQVGIPVTTSTYDEVDEKVTRTNDTFVMEASSLRMLALGHVSVSPLVGKLMWLGGRSIPFDLHVDVIAGLAVTGSNGEALTTGGSLALGAGGGFRVFISDVIALTGGIEALTVDRALSVNRDSKETGKKLRFNTLATLGLSFFMPPQMRRGD